MALVADYSGSSSEGEEDEETVPKVVDHISDEEESWSATVDVTRAEPGNTGSSIFDEEMGDGIGASIGGGLGLSAPSQSLATISRSGGQFQDAEEDTSDLPKPKHAEKADAPIRPIDKVKGLPALGAARKRASGRVKIALPSLSQFQDDDDDDPQAEHKRPRPSISGGTKKMSTLLTLLPPPKQTQATSLGGAKESTLGTAPKTTTCTTSRKMLVPDSVSRRMAGKAKAKSQHPEREDSSDEDDSAPSSFFTIDDKDSPASLGTASASAALSTVITANPSAVNPANMPLAFKGRDDAHAATLEVLSAPGPSSAPGDASMVGPALPSHPAELAASYPQAEDLMANEEALNRLAGAHALRNKEGIEILDVKSSDLTADTREWLTKALTEDDTDKPGPKNTIKGEKKKKHQITYLAAHAKENEHKLKQQWATNFANKKAAGARYGFF